MSQDNITMKCGCEFESGKAVADKVRKKGADQMPMPTKAKIHCTCNHDIEMDTLVYQCSHCKMTYAVTPCSASEHKFIVPAGYDY
ncbi:hypothetical protein [Haloplasma contractile]|uniref:Uncharacterized protein n=1 Tax=Haloplasma contractile SSD-17B TaxID=1033810 RepID=U2FMN7_9MOLU|nr:hypothetical protein [Haloplasma contractile]ERJ12414.1 hypothetical protein HLPCO_001400 [Haloplasma contractile SSD-17B]